MAAEAIVIMMDTTATITTDIIMTTVTLMTTRTMDMAIMMRTMSITSTVVAENKAVEIALAAVVGIAAGAVVGTAATKRVIKNCFPSNNQIQRRSYFSDLV